MEAVRAWKVHTDKEIKELMAGGNVGSGESGKGGSKGGDKGGKGGKPGEGGAPKKPAAKIVAKTGGLSTQWDILRSMGISAEDWSRVKGAISGGNAAGIETDLPAEYRELVGRYFQVIAKEAGKE